MGISREMQVTRLVPLAVIAAGLPLAAASAAPAVQLAQATPPKAAAPTQAAKPMTKAEFTKGLDGRFTAIDTNKDNQVSLAEFKAALPPVTARETPAQMLAQLDGNKDGKVSTAEYRAIPLANFDKMDANKDGIVTQQEVAAARRN